MKTIKSFQRSIYIKNYSNKTLNQGNLTCFLFKESLTNNNVAIKRGKLDSPSFSLLSAVPLVSPFDWVSVEFSDFDEFMVSGSSKTKGTIYSS